MDIGPALLALLVGYLSGSVSYAVLVTRLVAPETTLSKLRVAVPDSDLEIESDTISATTVRLQVGPRYGGLVALLDMAKAAVPALIFIFLYPDTPYYLMAAGMATVGHNWPVFHRFHGGRGISPILGGMLVVDWLGLIVTNVVAAVFGIWAKNMVLMTGGFMILMIPWAAYFIREPAVLIYIVAMNVVFWLAMIPEIKEVRKIRQAPDGHKFQEATVLKVIGEDGTVREDTITVPALRQKIMGWFKKV